MAKENIKYWTEISDYDLETAKAMLQTGRYLYVAFMCHQAIEKILKAYWCAQKEGTPPYIHNLYRLAEGCGMIEQMNESQMDFIDLMIPMNIEARYPSYKENLSKLLSEEKCAEIIRKTEELLQWIKDRL